MLDINCFGNRECKAMEGVMFKKGLRILQIEDDAVEKMSLQRIFRKLSVPHHLETAANGEEALLKLRSNQAAFPHIILLDLHMPLMNGIEFLAALRADTKLQSIAVYVMTSSDLPEDRDAAVRLRVSRYVVKPFTTEKYQEAIVDLLLHWESIEFEVAG